jgi:hypothetical protein
MNDTHLIQVPPRRLALKAVAAVSLGAAASRADAFFDPVTVGTAVLLFKVIAGVVVGISVMSLAAAADRRAFVERSQRERNFHDDGGTNHLLKPELRDHTIPLPDEGVIICSDGFFRSRPPGTRGGRFNDLSPSELQACVQQAPYTDQPRQPWPDTPAEARKRLEAISELARKPMQHMRYARVMYNRAGRRHTVYSAMDRNRQVEVLTLWERRGPTQRVVAATQSPQWTLANAPDLT